jgi:hypothetical protein
MLNALAEGKQLINISTFFTALTNTMPPDVLNSGLGEEGPPHPTDSHPPLSERMKTLHLTVAQVASSAFHTTPPNPAIDLISEAEQLERELTDVQHALMMRQGQAQIQDTASTTHDAPVDGPEDNVPSSRPLSLSPKVQASWNRARELTSGEQRPTISDLLALRREAQSLHHEDSLTVTDQFSISRLIDAIDDTLDKTMDQIPELRNSPEAQQLRRERAQYKEAYSPEFQLCMERYCESASEENTKALGALLFLKEHRARLMFILDYAAEPERAAYAKLFADWVRLQGFSPSEIAEHVDAEAVQRLTHTATTVTSDTPQTRAKGLADLLNWWWTEIVVPSDAPDANKLSEMYDLEDLEVACRRVADSTDDRSLGAALQSLAARRDAAQRLVQMFHYFEPRLTGDNAELVAEMKKLLRPLAEFDYGTVSTKEAAGREPETPAESAPEAATQVDEKSKKLLTS